ncbi:MAG TPA: sigma 54-interacting transcriptional regulator [Polyangiaceae bacterium]|nr:sigma 54-interacting transcriptional regulator [Polyangiaceae bacterium]
MSSSDHDGPPGAPSDGEPIEISTRALSAAGAAAAVHAVVLSGSAKGTSRPIGDRCRIGKASDNDIVLADDTVSRHHCELTRRPDGVHVRDLGSTNGTRVQGARVTEAVLQPGAVIKVGEVDIAIRPAVRNVEVLPSDKSWFGGAIGQSLGMRSIFGILERIAPTDATVLLEGETGTGKDVLARAVWTESARAQGPFVVVDCGAVSYSLLESELFGHERGAFTGAVAARQGAFELADGGTVFLDEIGELPLDVQPKLLRVLEAREFRRVGGNKMIKTDVRVIVATKRNLQREVQAGKFREDLYFRLAVVPITVPPLRARREDVPMLVDHMLKASGAGLSVSTDTMQALAAHDWPGNVRELRNVLERALYLARASGQSELSLVSLPMSGLATGPDAFQFEAGKSYRETRAKYDTEFERRYVKWLLARHGGNVSAAARDAKMDRKHLHDMAKKHGLRGPEVDED